MLARKALAGTAGAPKVYVEDVFSTYLYAGNDTARTITNGVNLSNGGLVWFKARNTGIDNYLVDSVRGGDKYLVSNSTAAQTTTSFITSFNNNGFGLSDVYGANGGGLDLASWAFAEQAKFFDIVTYTGDGTAGRTVSHNLGSVPGVIIVKCTSAADNWTVYHRSLGGTKFLELNATGAAGTSASRWNDTDPTSTVFTVGSDGAVNGNGSSYVAYLFAHDAGGFGSAGTDSIIYCSSYTGNGSNTGPEVTIGWQPQWLLVKRATGGTGDWTLYDSARDTTNSRSFVLYPNTNQAEEDTSPLDFLSTGFQPRSISTRINGNGDSYVYIAIRKAD